MAKLKKLSPEKMAERIELLSIDKLIPYEKNTRIHKTFQVDQIMNSIKEFGFTNPILISKENGIIAGHGRLMAAKKLKMDSVPTICLDYLTPEQQRAYIIADNKIAENAEWDFNLLADELQNLNSLDFDVSLLGFSDEELDNLLNTEVEEDEEEEEDLNPLVPEQPVSKLGDLWELGTHRLICGSCTDVNTYKRLMGNHKVDQVLTDPPYGVDYEAKRQDMNKRAHNRGGIKHKEIANDKHEDYRKFFAEFLSIIDFAEHNTIYCFLSGQELHNLRLAFEDCEIKWSDYLIWLKNSMVMNRKDYNAKHEFIVYGWKDKNNKLLTLKAHYDDNHELIFYGWKGKHKFFGPTNATTIIEHPRPSKADLHPTMKPVGLLEQLLSHGSKRNGIVYEPFAGSGSTLIACENKGRKCFAIELEPKYCDVIINRWQDLTKQEAKLNSTGETFNELRSNANTATRPAKKNRNTKNNTL